MPRLVLKIFLFFFIILLSKNGFSQMTTVSGTVYDITKKTPVEAVSVLSTSGNGTFTDSLGQYSLRVSEKDSIYFSFLNKPTPKYPVKGIANISAFDIAIQKKVQELPGVFIKQRNYRQDSLQNRLDYEKVFNYKKPGFRISSDPTPGGIGAGIDLDALINAFKFKKNKRMANFQNRLLREEQEKFVSHRFNKGLVRKLTGLTAPDIDSFMAEFRPSLEIALQFNDLEFGQYIVEAYKYYKQGIKLNRSAFRRELD